MLLTIKPGPVVVMNAACPEHQCPIIAVEQDGEEQYQCVIAVVCQLIAHQRVTRVKTASDRIRSIWFENGYQLTPLCPCCGQASMSEGGVLKGKMIVDMSWETSDYDEEHPELVLHFAKTPEGEVDDLLPIHIDSICTLQKGGSLPEKV